MANGRRTIQIGDEFTSYEELQKVRVEHEHATNTQLIVAHSKLLKESRRTGATAEEVENLRYKELNWTCKYAGELTSTATQKQTATYKCGCTYKTIIRSHVNTQNQRCLRVTDMISEHKNHTPTAETFMSLPRQRRATIEEAPEFLQNATAVRGTAQMVKSVLNRNPERSGGKVTNKDVYNAQTRVRERGEETIHQTDDLTALLQEMQKIPGSVSGLAIDATTNNVEGVYFQTLEMKNVFSAYPEMIFVDATYSVNNRNMPLQVVMCVDGEGETQIAALLIIRSENVAVMNSLFGMFIDENPNADKVEIIMVDKHISNLTTFTQVFPNAQINLCIFHVAKNFRDQITTKKRNITKEVKTEALSVVTQMIHVETEQEYDDLYESLKGIASDNLIHYFDTHWHTDEIRKMWAGYHVNQTSHYDNRTNNRTESFNQKLKTLLTKHASLKKFFKDTLLIMETMADERDYRTITRKERQPARKVTEDPVEHQYKTLLTSFAFKKLKVEIDESRRVQFSRTDPNTSFLFTGNTYVMATNVDCSCIFFKTMRLPCRHGETPHRA